MRDIKRIIKGRENSKLNIFRKREKVKRRMKYRKREEERKKERMEGKRR